MENGMSSPDNRFAGIYDSDTLVVIICSALALYNALELILLIFTTFHHYRGLYFWSLVLASGGIIPYVLGFLIEYFTGQSVVLYSRLWLVFGASHYKLLQAVKWMITVDAFVFHCSTVSTYFDFYNRGKMLTWFQRSRCIRLSLQC